MNCECGQIMEHETLVRDGHKYEWWECVCGIELQMGDEE